MAEGAERAYLAGLKLLAQRELSELQLRDRLVRRRFDPEAVDAAVERLRRERVVDDRRAALACVRAQVNLRHRGRLRVLHELRGIGIDRDTARRAVDEVFGELDEDRLLEQALERKLRRGARLDHPAAIRRVHRYLISQGFDPSRVVSLVRTRAKGHAADIDEFA